MNPEQEGMIEVTAEQAKIIGETVCDEIKRSLGENAPIYDRAKRCENQYNQVTAYMERGKSCDNPWKGAADYFIPMTEWIIDAVSSRVLNTLFGDFIPYMKAQGVESSDVAKAPGVTDFVDTILREKVKIYENTRFYFKQMIKLPFAVLKYDWVSEFEPMIVKESAQTFINPASAEEQYLLPDDPEAPVKVAEFIANGYQPSEPKDVWVLVEKELKNAPEARYINFSDYVWCPSAKRGCRLYWEGDRFWLTLNEIRLKVQQEKFLPEGADEVRNSLDFSGKSGAEKVVAERSQLRECFCWYGRLPFDQQNKINFESDEAFEQEVVCIVDYKTKALLQVRHWPHHRIPNPDRVYIRGEFEETENFEGRSLAEKLYMTQKYMNTFYNTLMNNAWLAMQKIFIKKKFAATDIAEPEVYPGAIWEEENTGDIRVLEVGDVKAIGLEIENNLISFAERISNVSMYQTGAAGKGGKTASEVLQTIREGNFGLDKFITNCHNILKKICKWTVDYYADRMPPGLERRILGDNQEQIFPTQENAAIYEKRGINPYWQKDDVRGEFDFNWQGTSISADKEWQITVANDLGDRYLPHPMISGNLLATWDILRRGLEARGIKDWQNILPPKEAIINEMKMMQQEAQMRQQQAQQQGQQEAQQQAMAGAEESKMRKLDQSSRAVELAQKIKELRQPAAQTAGAANV